MSRTVNAAASPAPDRAALRAKLSLSEAQLDVLLEGWTDAMPPADLLAPAAVEANLRFCSVDPQSIATTLAALPRIVADADLGALTAHLNRRLFESECDPGLWPDVADDNPLLALLYLIAGTAMVPAVRTLHERLGVDEAATRETCREAGAFCGNHLVAHPGRPGVLPGQLFWLRHYPVGRLFGVGRFEYMLGEYRHAGPVYRHREHGWTVACADPASAYTPDGTNQCDAGEPGAWTPTLVITRDRVAANPIDPRGTALRTTVTLDRSEWELVLEPGDPVLDMHIPAGGGMTPQRARDSFLSSFDFFERFVTKTRSRAIVCHSWILNPQLEEALPEGNLASLIREVYLLPCRSSGTDGMMFVYWRTHDRLSDYPRETSLQRALLGVLESGRKLRSASMFFLRSDLDRFGTQRYREGWPEFARSVGIDA